MDNNVGFMGSAGTGTLMNSKIESNVSKEYNCKHLINISSGDTDCDLTNMLTSQNRNLMSDEKHFPVSSHLKDKPSFKSGSGINVIANDLEIEMDLPRPVDFEHKSIPNGNIAQSDISSRNKCEKFWFSSGNTCIDCKSVYNSVNSHVHNIARSHENIRYNDGDEVKVETTGTEDDVKYVSYKSEVQMQNIMRLIQKDLSEPYSIYTYRYFIHNWPKLCFLAMDGIECIGAIVSKLDVHRKVVKRGYIAMLAVNEKYRKRKIGSNLVLKAIRAMVEDDADEVVLETEITNRPALRLYENLGFVRDKRLFRYYLNGVDALRLKLWLR